MEKTSFINDGRLRFLVNQIMSKAWQTRAAAVALGQLDIIVRDEVSSNSLEDKAFAAFLKGERTFFRTTISVVSQRKEKYDSSWGSDQVMQQWKKWRESGVSAALPHNAKAAA